MNGKVDVKHFLPIVLLMFSVGVGAETETEIDSLTFPDGSTYVGEVKDGKSHGQGTYTYSDGTQYPWERSDRWDPGTS